MSLRALSLRAGYELAVSVCLVLTLGMMLCWNEAAAAQSLIAGSVNPLSNVYPQAYGVIADAAGNVYYVDDLSGFLWKAAPPTSTGQFWTLTQLVGGFSGAQGIAIDGGGNIFIADTGNNEVKEVPAAGGYSTVSVLAGGAVFNAPAALALAANGDIFVADTGNNEIGYIPATNRLYAAAHIPTSVTLQQPSGIAVDAAGNLYLSNLGNNTVVRLTESSGWSSGTSLGSGWKAPRGLAVDNDANVYVVDSGNGHVDEVLAAGGYTAQTLVTQYGFYQPAGLGLDSYGDLFVTVPQADEIFEIAPQTTLFPATALGGTSVALNVSFTGNVNGNDPRIGLVQALTLGASSQSQFSIVNGSSNCSSAALAYQASCSMKVTFTPTMPGVVRGAVVAYDQYGNALGSAFLTGVGRGPQVTFPGNGSRLQVESGAFLGPQDVAFDGSGNLFVADQGHQAVEKYNSNTNSLSTVGPSDLSAPQSVALDGAGNLFISDNGTSLVRESYAPNYKQTVTVGSGFSGQKGIAVDGGGNLFVTDTGNHQVKELTAASQYQTTFILGGGFSFPEPTDVAVDSVGNLYVSDRTAGAVYKLPASCGYCSVQTFVNGFYNPRGVTVDASDSLYVSDTDDGRLYEIASVGGTYPTKVLINGSLNYPAGLTTDSNGNLWVAESGSSATWISELRLSQGPTVAFGATPQYQTSSDSPRPVLMSNRGNAPLIFSMPSSGYNPSISSNFTYTAPGGAACPVLSTSSAPAQLAASAQCELDISFTPQAAGSISGQLIFNDNNLNQPAGGPGTQYVTLTGTSVPGPAILSVSPSQGPIAGGATVTITGTSFTGVTSVSFGSYAAQSFSVQNSTTITAVTPAATSPQTVNIILSTGQFTSSATASDRYTFVQSPATVTFNNWQQTYNGSPVTPSATTSPSGLALTYTWNGSTTLPANAGTYTIVATINDYRYTGSASATVTINPATATCLVDVSGGTRFVWNGNPQSLPVETTPSGIHTTVTYYGMSGAPTEPGTYAETCTVSDPNYTAGTNQENFTIVPATASITLSNTTAYYTGSPISVQITVTPASETASARVMYGVSGSTTPPTNAGSYSVHAVVSDAHYFGEIYGQLIINKLPTTITIQPTVVPYNGSPQSANITVSPSTPIAVTYNGSSTVPTNAGTYNVGATTTDPNYSGSATGMLTISQVAANLSFSSYTVPYDGNAHPVSVTNPHNVSYTVTYNGSIKPPVSPDLAKEISPRPMMFDETRRDLKIWEILELFLSANEGKASIRDFQCFLSLMEIDATPQAIESAIKVHPELFETQTEGRQKFLTLRAAAEVAYS